MKQTLYNPKREGDSGVNFHKCYDNKIPLLFLIKRKEGKIFDIFISKSWKSNCKTYKDSTQKIISLNKIFTNTILNDNDTYFFNPNQGTSFN